ncbi:hypothetical protein ABZV31_20350 [Streptomyces sp. NPDC005202]|uniref:hypothetical protein n=1 Tax=Streptomyces sp. NPDC005202 TaxID=3157021 RepID=UPI0033B6C051
MPVEQGEGRQRVGRPAWGRVAPGVSRATTFELFFGPVCVFTPTQITEYTAHEHTAAGVLRGMLPALAWFSWSACAHDHRQRDRSRRIRL